MDNWNNSVFGIEDQFWFKLSRCESIMDNSIEEKPVDNEYGKDKKLVLGIVDNIVMLIKSFHFK